ncbi:hypothetical protein LMG29542_08105 [Paraburkholderia humisilvae]|uniref:Uncharacterized protein n=1 Tax=Paraburkholderia humisilvae TaxID=627669 RepID=A0A6J5FB97_9BURK|nr:hypothetical protein LMG29542_08105 [Paraburkholderia humisilvae]
MFPGKTSACPVPSDGIPTPPQAGEFTRVYFSLLSNSYTGAPLFLVGSPSKSNRVTWHEGLVALSICGFGVFGLSPIKTDRLSKVSLLGSSLLLVRLLTPGMAFT